MVEKPFALKTKKLKELLKTDLKNGLSQNEAEKRLKKNGENRLITPKSDPIWKLFLAQLQNFLIYILLAGIVFSFLAGEFIDGIIILIIVIGNALLAFSQKLKAEKDLEAIKKVAQPHCQVKRNGKIKQILASQLVLGDILILNSGDEAAADARIFKTIKLEIDESSLTGESQPIKKQVDPISDAAVLADRTNMCYKNTLILYGRGEALVTAIGMKTEVGKIASHLITTEKTATPLEKQLESVGKELGFSALIICGLIFSFNWILHQDIIHSLINSTALAIAVVPEGLPATITISLAIGVQVMRKKNAIVRQPSAVETLGSTDYLCTDKTGTITYGDMNAVRIFFDGKVHKFEEDFDIRNKTFKKIINVALSCNNATDTSGSPTERALYKIATQFIDKKLKRVDENPFDSIRKQMSTTHQKGNKYLVLIKGSPENIIKNSRHLYEKNQKIKLSSELKAKLKRENFLMSEKGLRVLAFAEKANLSTKPKGFKEAENNLTFLGFIGFKDPVRKDAIEAIEEIKKAGIVPIMITGDQQETAFIVAKEAGILEKNAKFDQSVMHGKKLKSLTDKQLKKLSENIRVYARVTSEDKLRIIKSLQSLNHVVAMTGDGINDAPAVKAADIGLAMGIRGTEVTKGAADIILTDDNYQTINTAIAQGRTILRNIKFFTSYLLSCNVSEIGVVLSALLLGLPFPFNARLLLWLNIVTDFMPAVALAYEPIKQTTMKHGPTPAGAPIIDRRMWLILAFQSFITSTVAIFVYLSFRGNHSLAVTAVFVVLALAEIFRAFTARSHVYSLFFIGVFTNNVTNLATLISFFSVLILIYIPFMRSILGTVFLHPMTFVYLSLLALFMPLTEEVTKLFIRKANFKQYREP